MAGIGDAEGFDVGIDLDEEHSKLLLVECARDAAVERSRFVGAVLAELARISAGVCCLADEWADVLDDVDAASADLMMRQACYRAAGSAIAEPVAASLVVFLA